MELGGTLREYFAAHALTGMLAKPFPWVSDMEYASRAYRIADAMLLARRAGRGG